MIKAGLQCNTCLLILLQLYGYKNVIYTPCLFTVSIFYSFKDDTNMYYTLVNGNK